MVNVWLVDGQAHPNVTDPERWTAILRPETPPVYKCASTRGSRCRRGFTLLQSQTAPAVTHVLPFQAEGEGALPPGGAIRNRRG
jgi:hypothetical protein